MPLNLLHTYAQLGPAFGTVQPPTPVTAPRIIRLNKGLAQQLCIDTADLTPGFLSGNDITQGSTPFTQAYAGHQFGGWVPRLGDGRACLLGEIDTPKGRFDLQLKGSGPTLYSRRGDGRAALGPVLREYIVSEAMSALGVPTTRALAAITTGEKVQRETAQPGAILARIAASHIRVGTFQYFFAQNDEDSLKKLTEYTINRHYPQATSPLNFLDYVTRAQAQLIARWLSIGFIHGVMNTDNMTLSGETIDYGPCAFLDSYRPNQVFSSIDQFGRYAYNKQPDMALWNLAQLATSLLPLMGPHEGAIQSATDTVHRFERYFQTEYSRLFAAKLGFAKPSAVSRGLTSQFLSIMAAQGADFTRSFHGLATGQAHHEFNDPAPFNTWRQDWLLQTPDLQLAAATNPAIIPRNHQIAQAITAAETGDFTPFHTLTEALETPFAPHPTYQAAPAPDEQVYATFCGT
jgi:uncharacterized protein YdiU (UPF0061 family)